MRNYQTNSNWGTFYKVIFKIVKIMKKQGNIEKLTQIEGNQEVMMTKCNIVFWIQSWNKKKDLSGKTCEAHYTK